MNYKEKLEEAKMLYELANDDQKHILESLFPELPELTESEDERIRKNLITCISTFKHPLFSEIERKEFLTWLEKQKAIDVLDAEEREFADNVNSYRKDMDEFYQKGYDAGREAEKQYWLEKQRTSEEAMQYLKENHSPSEVSDFQTAMNIAVAKAYDKGVKDGLENRGQTFTKKEVDDAYLAGVRDTKQELEKKSEQNLIMAKSPQLGDQKPAWSEENENEVAILEAYIRSNEWSESHINRALSIVDELVNKCKSLKDRVGCEVSCTTTKEWSEEDKNRFINLISLVKCSKENNATKAGFIEFINKLKSIKPQNTWKPSKEQMEALEHFVRSVGESGYASPYENNTKLLYSLLEQLKKL